MKIVICAEIVISEQCIWDATNEIHSTPGVFAIASEPCPDVRLTHVFMPVEDISSICFSMCIK
jgi:hypothetical protein